MEDTTGSRPIIGSPRNTPNSLLPDPRRPHDDIVGSPEAKARRGRTTGERREDEGDWSWRSGAQFEEKKMKSMEVGSTGETKDSSTVAEKESG
ncbi:hypothetical protein NDU88_006402 [Pleurodeles waltl]|uniref:Uncharacterized protein n=1 Tax=Pleurodeles waltl TaxID=8319 RepID=A0AAV7WAH8_PLEWA|nr:hypothetical protein NDU88_006402 [Pleurodeles waltl]